MGILDKVRSRKTDASESTQITGFPEHPKLPSAGSPNDGSQAAAPCGECGCTVFYRYASFGLLICGQCRAPDLARVKSWRSVVLVDGRPTWVPHHAELAKAAERRHPNGRPGEAAEPAMAGNDRTTSISDERAARRSADQAARAAALDRQIVADLEVQRKLAVGPPHGTSIYVLTDDRHVRQVKGRDDVPDSAICWTWENAPGWVYLSQLAKPAEAGQFTEAEEMVA